jgi:hypothetical protein
MKIWSFVTLMVVLVSVGGALAAVLWAWLAPAARAALPALAPPLAAALLLVLYFNWRVRLKNQILAGDRIC